MTRRSGDLPKGGDERLAQQNQVVLKPENLDLMPVEVESNDEEDEASIDKLFARGYERDPLPKKVLKLLEEGASQYKELSLAHCQAIKDRLVFRGRLYVPNYHALKIRLCFEHHDAPIAGHPGKANTYERLYRGLFRTADLNLSVSSGLTFIKG